MKMPKIDAQDALGDKITTFLATWIQDMLAHLKRVASWTRQAKVEIVIKLIIDYKDLEQ